MHRWEQRVKNKKSSMTADIAYMVLFILLFVCVAYIIFSQSVTFNIAALCMMFAVLIISHFTAVTLGLILNVVIIFVGFTYYLYRMVSLGESIEPNFYFWIIMSPLLTVISHIVFRNVMQIEAENIQLKKQVMHFSIVDDLTELKNERAYEMEFPVYQRIAKRYGVGLMLVVWQFRYADDLMKMLGKNHMEKTVVEVSKAMEGLFRKEDVVYILSKDPYEWGSLMLTKEDSEDILRERIRTYAAKLDFTDLLGKNAPKLEIRTGIFFTQSEDETALSMLDKAKGRVQYDV